MAKQTKEQQSAANGVHKVVEHLALTGTGKEKLDIAREVLADIGDGGTEQDGAALVVTHLRRRGVNETTIGKAQHFIDSGMPAPEPQLPVTTTPGIAPVVVPQPTTAAPPTPTAKTATPAPATQKN